MARLLVLLVVVLLCGMPAVTLARIDSKPAVGRGLFGLSQSVNATNYPDAPAQLLALDEKTGDITVIGPILDGDTPLYFDSVTGWPFYAGGHASDGRTFAVLERPDRTPVLATIDLATGKATRTLPLADVRAIYGLFLIGAVNGEPYGAVLRSTRQRTFIDVGPVLANGSVARQVSFTHFVPVPLGISGGNYFGFLQSDVAHDVVDVSTGTVRHVFGGNCWYHNQWQKPTVAAIRGSVGFVDAMGQPNVLLSHQAEDGQYIASLARLNDTSPGMRGYCVVEGMSSPVSTTADRTSPSGKAAFDPASNQFHVLLDQQNGGFYATPFLATVDVASGKVAQTKLRWPSSFRGGIRQMVYHLP